MTVGLKFPKPVKVKKAPRPLQRSRMRKRPPRRLKSPSSDPAYLAFVRTLPCRLDGEHCFGPIHAHHAGQRPGVAMKAPDDTAVPLCLHHHACWHANTGPFLGLTKLERFAWSVVAIAETQRQRAEALRAT